MSKIKCKRCDGTGDIGYQGLYSEKSDYRKCPLCDGTGKREPARKLVEESMELFKHKPPVKMRAVGWGVEWEEGDVFQYDDKEAAEEAVSRYPGRGTVVRLYVRSNK